VSDTVEALLRLQRNPAARDQVFNIGSTDEISILGLAERVIRLLRSKSSIQFVPYGQAYAPGFDDMRRRKPVTDKLAQTTGFRPIVSLDEIIRLTSKAFTEANEGNKESIADDVRSL
jgi:UDP-glucose 4-epimerase